MSVVHVNSISGITSITSPSSSDVLTLHTSNNIERVRIDSSGRMMLGNTQAANMLDAASNLVVGGGSGSEGITIYGGASDGGFIAFADGTSDPSYRMGQIIYDHGGNEMLFRTNGNHNRLIIDSSGRLLVGGQTATVDTSTYNSKVQVMATDATASVTIGRFGNNASASAINLSKSRAESIGSHSSGDLHDDDVIGNIFWWGSDGGDYEEVARISVNAGTAFTGGSTPGELTFWTTGSNATTATERLRITSNGSLLLGGTAEVTDLTGDPNGQRGLVIGNTGMGNAGIAIINSTTGTGRIYFGDATGSNAARKRGQIAYYHNDSVNSDYMEFSTAGTERLRIGDDGQTTITAASGDSILHIKRSNTNTTGLTGGINFVASDDHSVANIQAIGDGDNEGAHILFKTTSAAAGDIFNAATVERLRIASDGQATFDKGAPASSNQVIARFQAESSRRLDIVWHDSGSLMGFDTPSSHSYIFKVGGSEKHRITSKGYREIRNYHYGAYAFTDNSWKSTFTIGDPGDGKHTTIKFILTLEDVNYRQGFWQGEFVIWSSNANGGPGVSHIYKKIWDNTGSTNWNGGTVLYQMSGGAFQFKAYNDNGDAGGNAYIHVLDVIGDIDGTTVASITA